MSTALRRFLLALVVASLPCALPSRAARAEDPAPKSPLVGDPEELASVSSFQMALGSEGLPKDWKLLEGADAGPDAKALEEAVAAIAKDKGVSTSEDYHVETRSASAPDGSKVHFAYYDLGAPSTTFVDALKAEGAKKGWAVRALGTERHGLVTAGAEAVRAKGEAIAVAWAGRLLTLASNGALESMQGRRALGFARVALALDAKSAGAHFVVGLMAKSIALQPLQEKKPIGDIDTAIAHLKASLDKDATNALSAHDTVIARGNLGQSVLNKGGPSAEARDHLKEAVAKIADVTRDEGIGFRYDLACAHARLKELDDAFRVLTSVLEDDAKEPAQGIREIWRTADEDLAPLRADERWKKLLEKFPE